MWIVAYRRIGAWKRKSVYRVIGCDFEYFLAAIWTARPFRAFVQRNARNAVFIENAGSAGTLVIPSVC